MKDALDTIDMARFSCQNYALFFPAETGCKMKWSQRYSLHPIGAPMFLAGFFGLILLIFALFFEMHVPDLAFACAFSMLSIGCVLMSRHETEIKRSTRHSIFSILKNQGSPIGRSVWDLYTHRDMPKSASLSLLVSVLEDLEAEDYIVLREQSWLKRPASDNRYQCVYARLTREGIAHARQKYVSSLLHQKAEPAECVSIDIPSQIC